MTDISAPGPVDMSEKGEFECESSFARSSDGCCADGRQCDELCIEAAAAYLCRQSCDSPAQSQNPCSDNCCTGIKDDKHGAESRADKWCPEDADTDCCNETDYNNYCTASDSNGNTKQKENITPPGGVTFDSHGCHHTACDKDTFSAGSANVNAAAETNTPIQSMLCSPRPNAPPNDEPPCPDGTRMKRWGRLSSGNSEHRLRSCDTTQEPCARELISCIDSSGRPDQCVSSHNPSGDFGCCTATTNESKCKAVSSHHRGDTKESCCASSVQEGATCSTAGEVFRINVRDEHSAYSARFKAAVRKLTDLFRAGLCVCRSVLQNADNCCDHKRRKVAAAERSRRRASATILRRTTSAESSMPERFHDLCRKAGVSSHNGSTPISTAVCESPRCHSNLATAQAAISPKENAISPHRIRPTAQRELGNSDVENIAERKQLVFSISGMTCTGCARKVLSVFSHIPGVQDVNVNYVAGIGECYFVPALISADLVFRRLGHETGFRYARIARTLLSLDLCMTSEGVEALRSPSIKGIDSIDSLKENVYRIAFDPTVIGARTILSRSNGVLASPSRKTPFADSRNLIRLKLWYLAASAVMTIPVVVLAWGDLPISYNTSSIIALVLATGVQVIAIPEFYIPATKALIFSKAVEMDMLVVISITAAYCYSVVAFCLIHAGHVIKEEAFFETSTLLITLVLLGRLVSAYAKDRAISAVSMKSLQADFAHLDTRDERSHPMRIDARLLELHDHIWVSSHSRIVTDGEVLRGNSAVDESMVTGECAPVSKGPGSTVVAGTMNGAGPLLIRVTRLLGQNSISDIASIVTDALGTKPKLQDLANVIAGWFVPVVVAIAIVVFIVWVIVSVRIRNENAGGATGTAITYAIAVLAISCPCALGLAVPLVLVIAGGVAAKAGVVIKSAGATERAFSVTDVVFDKTGTLTKGDLQVIDEGFFQSAEDPTQEDAWSLTLSLIKDNEHPVSQAVASHLRSRGVTATEISDIESIPGEGIEAKWKGARIKAGNPAWLGISGIQAVVRLQAQGLTLLCVTLEGVLLVAFGIRSTTRPEAASTIANLRLRGIQCHIVSGDSPSAVLSLARTLDVPEENVAAQKKPEAKREYIQAIQSSTTRKVLFIGDGTNDAAAIAQADVGLQIGDTSDISRAVADVVLLGGLDGIVVLLDVSKAAFRRIMFNFAWSIIYNVFAILLASGALVKFRVPPAYAGLGEMVSVLPVVAVALSMLWAKASRQR